MNLQLAYLGRSAIQQTPLGLAVSLAPNLRRDRVGFSGTLWQPLRFREAVSALHDIVVSDLRYRPKDRSAYQAFLAEQQERENALRRGARQAARAELFSRQPEPMPPGLEKRFKQLRETYWNARLKYSDYLSRHDPELWRMLVPCDPVITVAPDVLFFECFSKDESSYGCLTVERNAFRAEEKVALGTTNVDYSWTLYEEFQKLRSYRSTRFVIDPAGFEVQTVQQANYREEKIDLPSSWLRGFLQLQTAMSLPMRRVPVSREGLYNVLAWLKRRRAARSPRAVRFELEPGEPVVLVLEPWERRIVLHGTPYAGARETIRVWGRDRLRVLARLLPMAEGAEVYLLGTGLPSFWSVKLGEMRLLLGLSGWTANDWTGAGALDQLAPPAEPSANLLGDVAAVFKDGPALTFGQIQQRSGAAPPYVAAALNRLALMGQLIHDLPAGLYRWRQILPAPVAATQLGPDNPETEAARELTQRVRIQRDERTPSGLRLLVGLAPEKPVEVLLDGDGRIVRGKCNCSHHFKNGLRKGPCRHLQAVRNAALRRATKESSTRQPSTLERWFQQLWQELKDLH
ncbi:MAG TPA: hypothetical protein VMG10_27795 [Gemmataceae bacterium]|nr:hypothetical protein [Gemmataceae bacterium]